MKKKDLERLRKKTIQELEGEILDKKIKSVMTAAKISAGQEKNLKKVKELRREIATLLTIVSEKNREEAK